MMDEAEQLKVDGQRVDEDGVTTGRELLYQVAGYASGFVAGVIAIAVTAWTFWL